MPISFLVLAGPPRLAVLNTAGVVLKTLHLPPPKKGDGLALEFIHKGVERELEDYSEAGFTAGYTAKLTLKWDVYDDLPGLGVTIGTAEGNRPSLMDLWALTSGQVRGLLRVSPGPLGTGCFRVERVTKGPLGLAGPSLGRNVSLTFWGKDLLPTEALQDWV
jgi:hypothetical protein